MSLRDEKRAMRSEMARARRRVTPEIARVAGESAARSIAAMREFQAARAIAMFASRADEPDTRALFELARRRDIAVLMPRCREDESLDFFWLQAWEDLQPGRYGLLEPAEGPAPVRLDAVGMAVPLSLVIVPGVAFDPRGNRLGRGKGYYDRSLPPLAAGGPALVGLAFDFQCVERVPAGSFDRRMNAVVTESGLRPVNAADPLAGADCGSDGTDDHDDRIERDGETAE